MFNAFRTVNMYFGVRRTLSETSKIKKKTVASKETGIEANYG